MAVHLLYVALYSVGIFFNTALISIVLEQLDGRPASLTDGRRNASARVGAIAGYAVTAEIFGWVLRAIEERVGLIGRSVKAAIGTVRTVASPSVDLPRLSVALTIAGAVAVAGPARLLPAIRKPLAGPRAESRR